MKAGTQDRASWRRFLIDRPMPIFVGLFLLCAAIWWWLAVYRLGPKDTSDALTGLAILVGGSWTLYQFVLRRAFETALAIDYSVRSEKIKDEFVVFLQVTFANIGNRRITSPQRLSDQQKDDYERSIEFPADLQIRKLSSDSSKGFIGWWGHAERLVTPANSPKHVSLLFEYSDEVKDIDFFMEPGEKYTIGTCFVLDEGHYLAKIVFVGSRATAAEFWSRIIYFRVPEHKTA